MVEDNLSAVSSITVQRYSVIAWHNLAKCNMLLNVTKCSCFSSSLYADTHI